MSIKEITIEQLRQMKDQEGLVLQGCGGPLPDWQNGINDLLTELNILRDGSRFENIRVFEHEGRTCLLFPFSDDLHIDMGKLALWRLASHDTFGGTWLSDYVENRLGGFIQEQPKQQKPDCPLIGADSNVFSLIGLASQTLKEHGMQEQAREMRDRIYQCQSYDSALCIIGEYVNISSKQEIDMGEEMSMDW